MTIKEVENKIERKTLHFNGNDKDLYTVYFLIRDEHIVYIGKSSWRRVWKRVKEHLKDKAYDDFAVLDGRLTEAACLELEAGLITYVNPEYNKIHVSLTSRLANSGYHKYISRNVIKENWKEDNSTALMMFVALGLFLPISMYAIIHLLEYIFVGVLEVEVSIQTNYNLVRNIGFVWALGSLIIYALAKPRKKDYVY